MIKNHRYILVGHEVVAETDVHKWGQWMENHSRIVSKTELADCEISTVFLGLDHQYGDGQPLIFETMIFGDKGDQYQERYSTWDEAVAGHDKACRLVQNDMSIIELLLCKFHTWLKEHKNISCTNKSKN
jgi:hypothetical protein